MQKWEKLNDEQRRNAVERLIYFFEIERDEKIGVVAAGNLIDFFLQSLGKEIYNKGVTEAIKVFEARSEDLKFDLQELIEN